MTAGRVTFHHKAVAQGESVYLQPGEVVLSAEYEAEGDLFYVVIMCWLEGEPDGGVPG